MSRSGILAILISLCCAGRVSQAQTSVAYDYHGPYSNGSFSGNQNDCFFSFSRGHISIYTSDGSLHIDLSKNGSQVTNIHATGVYDASCQLSIGTTTYRGGKTFTITEIDTVRKRVSGTIDAATLRAQLEDTVLLSGVLTYAAARSYVQVRRDSSRIVQQGDTLTAFEGSSLFAYSLAALRDSNAGAMRNYNGLPFELRNGLTHDTAFQNVDVASFSRLQSFVLSFVPIGTPQGTYKMMIRTAPTDLVGDTLTFYVRVARRYYSLTCNGVSAITFDAGALNDGLVHDASGFERRGFSLLHSSGLVLINNFVKFNGDLTIDTATKELVASGMWYVDTVILPLVANKGRYVLDSSDERKVNFGADCKLVFLATSKAIDSAVSRLLGFSFSLDSINFIPGGIRFGCTITLPFKRTACTDTARKNGKLTKISIAPIEITRTNFGGMLQLSNFGFAPGWCVTKAYGSYYSLPDSLNFGAEVRSPFAGSLGIGAGVQYGQLNAVSFKVEATKSIPLGTSGLGLLGVRGSASGWYTPPMSCSIGGTLDQPAVPSLMNLDVDFSYNEPSTLKGKAVGKLFKVGTTWQGELGVTATLDWNKFMSLDGTAKVGTLGADYAFNGKASLKFTWSPAASLDGMMSGSLSIPKLGAIAGDDNLVNDYINTFLPITLTSMEGQLKARVLRANINYYNLFKGHFALDLNKSVGTAGFINCGFGNVPLSSTRQKHDEISSLPSDHTFTITSRIDQAFLRIVSSGAPASSYLINPSGRHINATESDSSIILVTTPEKAFWYLREPALGLWTLHVNDISTSSAVTMAATLRDLPFSIQAQQSGKSVTVTWDPSDLSPSSSIDLFLDTDTTGTDGIRVGTASASSGSATITLDEALPACSYHLYAIRDDQGGLVSAYASNVITADLRSLQQPSNITVYRRPDSSVRVWADLGPGATAMVVTMRDALGQDSVVSIVAAENQPAEFRLGDTAGVRFYVQSRDDQGLHSCPSELVAPLERVSSGIVSPIQCLAYPNPAKDQVTLTVSSAGHERVSVELYDVLGVRLRTRNVALQRFSTHDVILDVHDLAPGTYYYRVADGESLASGKVVIKR